MKTPDEIKKGLKLCYEAIDCSECPYLGECFGDDDEPFGAVLPDALAYIPQLERERDAAVEDMTTVIYNGAEIVCQFCKHRDEHKCAQICGFAFKGFEWRGVKED